MILSIGFISVMFLLFAFIVGIFLFIYIFPLPIRIASGKNLTNNEMSTIQVLTWCGLFVGVTWFIALFLAITYDDNRPAY